MGRESEKEHILKIHDMSSDIVMIMLTWSCKKSPDMTLNWWIFHYSYNTQARILYNFLTKKIDAPIKLTFKAYFLKSQLRLIILN